MQIALIQFDVQRHKRPLDHIHGDQKSTRVEGIGTDINVQLGRGQRMGKFARTCFDGEASEPQDHVLQNEARIERGHRPPPLRIHRAIHIGHNLAGHTQWWVMAHNIAEYVGSVEGSDHSVLVEITIVYIQD